MSPSVRFLTALANLLSKAALYEPGHPSREAAFDELAETFEALPRENGSCVFSFLDGEVIQGTQPLRELKAWPWSRRFAAAGIERIEFLAGGSREELRQFVRHLIRRLDLEDREDEPGLHPNIRFGALKVRERGGGNGRGAGDGDAGPGDGRAGAGAVPLDLAEEAEAVHWVHERAATADSIPMTEVALVVQGLLVSLRGARGIVAPLLRIKSADEYTSAHCINVSILSMSLAEYLGFAEREVRGVGEAALLHDIGKTRIPLEVLNKPGKLTPEERAVIERHPSEGARMLLGSGGGDGLAAVVTYEHHMHWNGEGGYPERHYTRKPHHFSRLVQVCDVYDALRTRRPFRAPLSSAAALEFLSQRAGSEFDPDFVSAFRRMMDQWEPDTLPRADEEDEVGALEVADLATLPEGRYDADTEQELFAAP